MTFNTIENAIQWMNEQVSEVPRQGIDKIKEAFNYLNISVSDIPVIHITGTNGKGSVTAYLKDLLQSQGLKVGTFTSPHIMKFNERISYNGEMINDEDLLKLLNIMYELNDYMATTPYSRLAFFELYTVMMGVYFSWKKPDVCVIEVGIGGYSDCTNIFNGKIAVLTTIGLDHADKLGNTVEEVAYEKSGIIKENALVVTGNIEQSCFEIIEKATQENNGQLYQYHQAFDVKQWNNLKQIGSEFIWKNDNTLQEIKISMVGEHQIDNAAVAIEAFYLWMNEIIHTEINWNKAKNAIARTKWLARMEKINNNPLIYIDGAHNIAGLQALKEMMESTFDDYTYTIIYSGLTTKNQNEQLPLILSFNSDAVYLTEFEHNHAMTSENFNSLELAGQEIPPIINWQEYIQNYMKQNNEKNHLLLVTGSLYFVSEVRNFVISQ